MCALCRCPEHRKVIIVDVIRLVFIFNLTNKVCGGDKMYPKWRLRAPTKLKWENAQESLRLHLSRLPNYIAACLPTLTGWPKYVSPQMLF